MYALHGGIPAPVFVPVGRPKNEYPFGQMTVGQSFFAPLEVDGKKRDGRKYLALMRATILRWRKTNNEAWKFRASLSLDPSNGAEAVGVWRVE